MIDDDGPFIARVTSPAPTSASSALFVTILSFDGGRAPHGPCLWEPPAGGLPVVGDLCVVVRALEEDGEGEQTVVIAFDRDERPALDWPLLESTVGAALSNVLTANTGAYATWPSGPSLTIPATGRYWLESGSILVQQTPAAITEARFSIARNGTPIGGSSVAHIANTAFAGACMIARPEPQNLLEDDVLTLRYATNNQQASFGGTGTVMIFARRIA